ncbi:MAG: hypothetical protein AAGC74_09970 [Verrucomicrobiota bacterium]
MKPVLLTLLLIPHLFAEPTLDLRAPNPDFDFIDQRQGPGNSCGPASLLNAFGSGSARWQNVFAQVPGDSDRIRILSIIKTFGLKDSSLPGRKRWQPRAGTNLQDLQTMISELAALDWKLPKTRTQLLFTSQTDSPAQQFRLAHKQARTSLKKGFPPILSIRRYVLRDGHWTSVHGHFIVLTAMPTKITRSTNRFPIRYCDPQGGNQWDGSLSFAKDFSCPVLDLPAARVGKPLIKPGEQSRIGLTALIGAF